MSAALEVRDKLAVLAGLTGSGKLEKKISDARGHLARINSQRWRSPQAPGRIYRFLHGKQTPQADEVDDVREAYRKFCDEKVKLARRVLSQIEYARRTDPDFHRETIEQLVRVLDQLGPFLHGAQQ